MMQDKDDRPVATAYQDQYCEVLGKRLSNKIKDGSLSRELEREQWQAVYEVLRAYSSNENLKPLNNDHSANHPREAFPPEVAVYLGTVLEELLTGRMPDTFKAVVKPHAPNYGPEVKGAIATAVQYANLARKGLITDRKPVVTIEEKFGIKRRTWKEWRKNTPFDEADPEKFFPKLQDDVSKRTSLAQNALERAAKVYRINGRPDSPVKGSG
ncbi:hypothetical protein [Terasakiella sp.]|uniref:hypothetical protein n=1 Tax=Terasakiella sp. TaxID=2034861 RepID=UPI003AA84E44